MSTVCSARRVPTVTLEGLSPRRTSRRRTICRPGKGYEPTGTLKMPGQGENNGLLPGFPQIEALSDSLAVPAANFFKLLKAALLSK